MSKKVALFFLWLYQALLSPARGFFRLLFPVQCQYSPSCSEYGVLAVEKHGALKGLWMAGRRILRCHPWSKSGVDLP